MELTALKSRALKSSLLVLFSYLSIALTITSDFSIDPGSEFVSTEKRGPNNGEGKGPPVASPTCKLPKLKGHECVENKSAVEWYFDYDTMECLAFKHIGCGGNENRFASPGECWSACKLQDYGSCAGQQAPAKSAKGEMIICWQGGKNAETCPTTYKCTMQAFFGICCPSQTQELYLRNYRPHCSNGKSPHSIENSGVPLTLIGKTCDDAFCPQGTMCHQKEIFAHCCPT